MAILTNANEILIDFDGNRAYLTDDKLYVYDSTDTTEVGGYLQSNVSDLGEPTIDKHFNGIDIDYKGLPIVYIWADDILVKQFVLPSSVGRTTRWVHSPLPTRYPFQKMDFKIITATAGTIIYSLEIEFEITKRRRDYVTS